MGEVFDGNIEMPPHLMLQLSARGFSADAVKEAAKNVYYKEQVEKSAKGIRYCGKAMLKDGREITIEFLDRESPKVRWVWDVVTGPWNR